MIEFLCPTCHTRYTVGDARAGLRTRCPRCRARLVVPVPVDPPEPPADRPPRPPAGVVAALAAVALGVLALAALAAYLLTPPPSRESVERRLRDELPAGYENLKLESYEPGAGRLEFAVSYREPGHVVATDYRVIRYASGDGWRVQVTGRRPRWDDPVRRPVVIDAVYDARGRVTERGVDAAGHGEAPAFDARARDIARAAHGAL